MTLPGNWDYLYLGESPADEDCQQVGDNYNATLAKLECTVLQEQIIRIVGQPPAGVNFKVTNKDSSYGAYELLVCYSTLTDGADGYALRCEENFPEKWDAEAKAALKAAGHPDFQ